MAAFKEYLIQVRTPNSNEYSNVYELDDFEEAKKRLHYLRKARGLDNVRLYKLLSLEIEEQK